VFGRAVKLLANRMALHGNTAAGVSAAFCCICEARKHLVYLVLMQCNAASALGCVHPVFVFTVVLLERSGSSFVASVLHHAR
jgi:hypothetical protein